MKILSEQQLDEANYVFLKNGAKAGLVTLAASSAIMFLAPKFTKMGKSLTLPIKAFFISSAATAGFVIKGEHALISYDRQKHANSVPDQLIPNSITPKRIELTSTQQIQNWVSKYRYYILFASWAAGMSVSGLYLFRKQNLTISQKIVEARMYAQAVTLLSLAGVAGVATDGPKEAKQKYAF